MVSTEAEPSDTCSDSPDTVMEEVDETTTYVAPLGDLNLIVEYPRKRKAGKSPKAGFTKTLVVCSTVLCLASPVWKAMLGPDGHFMEARQSHTASNREVRFPDDDPNTLVLLLNIAHLNFDKIPETVELERLLKIAILCDKYDMVELIRPWISKWADPLRPLAKEIGYEAWLFIAWTFGYKTIFAAVTRDLVLNSSLDSSGQLLNGSGLPLGDILPPRIAGKYEPLLHLDSCLSFQTELYEESITHARSERLKNHLSLCNGLINMYAPNPATSRCTVGNTADARNCDTIVLGSLIKGLKSIRLWPGPVTPAQIPFWSVNKLTDKLSRLTCVVYPGGNFGGKAHSQCRFTEILNPNIEDLNAQVEPSGVLDSHLKHMKRRNRQ